VPDSDRKGVILRSLAWTSSLNAATILAPLPDDVDGAYARYRALAARPAADPGVLAVRSRQPYPLPLPGTESRRTDSLLGAFDEASRTEVPSGIAPEVKTALEERLERVARKARSLAEEAESAPGKAVELRARANLLMARLQQVPKGASVVQLPDFEGGSVEIELDPTLSPVQNAEALYDRARKRQRAAERLPVRVREAAAERDRLASLLESLDSGTADPVEVAHWVAEVRPSEGPGKHENERLPYRTFRSSGGLEIRVGRSGRGNDELTFHHSSPDDIWLHARDMAGAHVILRWSDRQQNPPRRDLVEAAILAAVNSKGRTSGTVPVDWTRRKHVRSPRNAPPGAVIPDRVSTVFVEPDPDVEERLTQ
jgi:predicted ribosome quality control (RQC) complex YloA/Tae2 family protein